MLAVSTSASLPWWPFAVVLLSVLFIIFLITRLKLHPMLALLLAAIFAGIISGQSSWEVVDKGGAVKTLGPYVGVVEVIAKGLGDTARDIAISVALASIIAICLMNSGAADRVVQSFIHLFGERRAGLALLWATYVLSIPIFFDTMFLLMAPIAQALARRTGRDYTLYLMCVACGGVITHSMTIPHPGPLVMVDNLSLDPGQSLLAGLVGGLIPCALGYLLACKLNKWMPVTPPREATSVDATAFSDDVKQLPGLTASLIPVLLPIVLIAIGSIFQILGPSPNSTDVSEAGLNLNGLRPFVEFIGHKNVALLLGAGAAMLMLSRQAKCSIRNLETQLASPLEAAATIVLITCAGGAFGAMLRAIGISEAVTYYTADQNISLILLAWIIAAVVRLAQGSATVAMQTASSIVAPLLLDSQVHPIYIFLAIGWGALGGSWMNDSGFWVVSRFGGLTQQQTLRSWSLLLVFLSITGISLTYLASILLPLK